MTSPTETPIATIEVVGDPVGQPKHGMVAIPIRDAGKCSHGYFRRWAARAHPITQIKNADGSRKAHPIVFWRRLIVVASQMDCALRRISGPIRIDRVFRFKRLKSHWGTGRNEGKLKASAPKYHFVQPDPDNCDKPIFDSLKDACVITDDGIISVGLCTKLYCNPGESPGCTITIWELSDLPGRENVMKLIYCTKCHDLVMCGHEKKNKCCCGKSWGKYDPDGLKARYGGYAVPIGMCSESLTSAIARQGDKRSVFFESWVWEKSCEEFVKQEPPDV